jgi:hypothetical protein
MYEYCIFVELFTLVELLIELLVGLDSSPCVHLYVSTEDPK